MSTPDRPGRPIKRGKKAVSGGFDLATSETIALIADQCAAGVEQITPTDVPHRSGLLCGVHNIRRHDSREHAVGPLCRRIAQQELANFSNHLSAILTYPCQ